MRGAGSTRRGRKGALHDQKPHQKTSTLLYNGAAPLHLYAHTIESLSQRLTHLSKALQTSFHDDYLCLRAVNRIDSLYETGNKDLINEQTGLTEKR